MERTKLIILFASMLSIGATGCQEIQSDPIVTVKQGKLKGVVKNLTDGSPYYSFKGIPFAKTPVGELRFTAPLPPDPWQGTYDAVEPGPICPQYDTITGQKIAGNESCLFINVYTRSLKSNAKIPVMVFIHGGSLMSGSGSDPAFGPEFLLLHNVILVTFNYRLEVLGYLSLGIPGAPGNAGVKDQVKALQWVKNNIAQFGGDSGSVTLFGESSGSACVSFHMQSPMSEGLFQKGIAQSGVSIENWATARDSKARGFRLGELLGENTKSTTELLKFLRGVPALSLTNVTIDTLTDDEKYRGLQVQFVTAVEKKFDNVQPFILEDPIDALVAKKMHNVPLMLGYTSMEALIMLNDALTRTKFMNENPKYLVPRLIAERVSEEKTVEFGERIKKFYFGDRQITVNETIAITKMLSDVHFVYNTHRFAHFFSSISPTYLYRFSFDTELNYVKIASGLTNIKGASHADELFYLFYNGYSGNAYEKEQRLRDIVYRVTKLWTDFAKTGNPTPDDCLGVSWLPYSAASRNYLDIDEQLTSGQNAERDRVRFWNNLYCEAGVPSIPKCSL